MWISVSSSLSFIVVFLVLTGDTAVMGGRLDHYSQHVNKRPRIPPRRKINGAESAEDCAEICETLSSIRCTTFVFRKRGQRCLFYSEQDTKSIAANLDRTMMNVDGFTTFQFENAMSKVLECIADGDLFGTKYRGTQSTTVSGRTCQKWIKNKPHRPIYRPRNAAQDENYCRNPDGDTRGVWCYTTDTRKRWEYCSVPECSETTTELPRTTTTAESVSPSPAPEPEICYVCNGDDYLGDINRSITGKVCQRWDASSPHQHTNHPSQKPGLNLEKNYCRNPDGDIRPWCYTTDPNVRWEYCEVDRCTNSDGSVLIPRAQYTTECTTGTGSNYRGNVSRTKSGKECIPWTSQSLHRHTKTPENYPCSGLESNYCRNPSKINFDEGPWCYTIDPSVRWELCDIPQCGPDGRPVQTTPTARSTTTTAISFASTTTEPATESRPTPTATSETCGIQAVEPSIETQTFNIAGGQIRPTTRRKRSAGNRILGGDDAVHGSWPWAASLRFYDVHFCGGTLIKRRWVLTAAHCLDDNSNAVYMSVKIGHHKGGEPQMQMRKVHRYVLHSAYSKRNVKNDIALVQLTRPFDLTDYVRIACIPEREYIVPGDSYCIVAGWGNTHDSKYENQLKQAVLPVHSYADCIKYMGSHMVNQTQMCAGWKGMGHDTCRGDSGGPLVCLNNNFWTVQGVTSWGSGCESKKGSYGSYSRVSKYIDWINEQIARFGE